MCFIAQVSGRYFIKNWFMLLAVHISSHWMHLGSLESSQEARLLLFSELPACIHNSIYAIYSNALVCEYFLFLSVNEILP